MKVLEFTYTKKDCSISQRAIVEQSQPSAFVSGIDISSMNGDTMVEFAKAYNQLRDRQAAEFNELIAQFDCKHNYRQFNPELMTDVTAEFI